MRKTKAPAPWWIFLCQDSLSRSVCFSFYLCSGPDSHFVFLPFSPFLFPQSLFNFIICFFFFFFFSHWFLFSFLLSLLFCLKLFPCVFSCSHLSLTASSFFSTLFFFAFCVVFFFFFHCHSLFHRHLYHLLYFILSKACSFSYVLIYIVFPLSSTIFLFHVAPRCCLHISNFISCSFSFLPSLNPLS